MRKFADALVKSSTNVPMNKTNIMLVQPFLKLFDSWQENDFLSIKNLCMKAICLLSLTFMHRPSDIAPRSVRFDSDVGSYKVVFSEHISFHDDGGLSITFHGMKNDYDRDGFTVKLPPVGEEFSKIDPIRCLRGYVLRTSSLRLNIEH